MGLFKKNKKKDKKNDLYGENLKQRSALTSFDNMAYIIVRNNSDDQLFEICDTILSGKAVLANFNKISSSDANMMLSFISGVLYALDGEYHQIEVKLFLFGRKEEFEDGSLYQYVEDSK